MTFPQQLIVYCGLLGSGLTVAGLILRGQWRIARSFTAYLAFMWVTGLLVAGWPATFWTWSFWLFKQIAFDTLELATAFELAYWVFLGFPGAARSARATMFALAVGTFLAVVAIPHQESYGEALTLTAYLRPRVELGIGWLFVAIAVLVRWYDIPLHPTHRAIILGMTAHLCIFGLFLHAMGVLGLEWATGEPLVTLVPAAFAGICFWWAWCVWQPNAPLVGPPGLVKRLQPWRRA